MKNTYVKGFEEQDIKKQIDKILRGLGYPEPPLSLEDVCSLLKLDLRYYSSEDDGPFRETISRLKIAGKQIISRPSLLIDVVKKAKLSALWLPDHKRILIDNTVPHLKHRWMKSHEIGHSIIPWHKECLFGDDSESLSPSCHETLENEANFAGGQLLFLLDRFSKEANDMPVNMASVLKLKDIFGNTITSTLWRFVENSHFNTAMVGIISQHPKKIGKDFDHENPCKYIVESKDFKKNFSNTAPIRLYSIIEKYCSPANRGLTRETEAVLADDNGQKHIFHFQTFYNGYNALTLGVYKKPVKFLVV